MNITIDPSKTLERPVDPTLSLLDFALDDQAIRDSGHDPDEVRTYLDGELRKTGAVRLGPGVYQPAPGAQADADMIGVAVSIIMYDGWIADGSSRFTYHDINEDGPEDIAETVRRVQG